MNAYRNAVFLILEICLLSVLAVDVLPQTELRELDIFMQDEEYQQITRAKRTEEIQEEGDYSGEGPLSSPEPLFVQDENEPIQTNSTDETPPENSGSNSESKIEQSSVDTIDSGPEIETEPPTGQSTNISLDISQIDPVSSSNLDSDQTSLPVAVDNTDSAKAENASDVNPPVDVPVDVASNTELPPPIVESRSGFSKDNTTGEESTQETTEVDISLLARENASTNTSLDSVQEIPQVNVTLNSTQDTIDPSSRSNIPEKADNSSNVTVDSTSPPIAANTTDNVTANNSVNTSNNTATIDNSETPKINMTNTNVKDVEPTKPVVAESDQPKQGGVTGAGVLLTIIILVAIAALASIGYVIYKRRMRGYSPVSVSEDHAKEMTEIENGIGKPIRADEIRIQDQLTPVQPVTAPRTFAATPTSVKKLDDEETKSNDERNARDQSFEFNDERKKNDE